MHEMFGRPSRSGRTGRRGTAFGLGLAALALTLAPTRGICAEGDGEEAAADETRSEAPGLVVHVGDATASFRFFADVGAAYDGSIKEEEGAKANFLAGTFDFFSTVRLGDHFQTLTEVVAEFDDTNEVGFELERIWGQWSRNDALYVKLGREHAPVSYWNRHYHHGRIFWPAVSQPFLAKFEDQGGPLPIHASGVEIGGNIGMGSGRFGYVGGISNGRGVDSTEVENIHDRNGSKAWDAGVSYAFERDSDFIVGVNYRDDRIPGETIDAPELKEAIVTIFTEWRGTRWYTLAEAAQIRHDSPSGPAFDHRSGYVQVNLRLDKVSPYARFDVRSMDRGDPFYLAGNLDLDRRDILAGVRLDIHNQVALKIEASFVRGEMRLEDSTVDERDFEVAALGLQWVF